MLPPSPTEQLTIPAFPSASPRPGFPVVATLAPVLVSAGIWAVTGSPYSLLFAFLGPVVAGGSLLDGRTQRRKTMRRETEVTRAALRRMRERVDLIHERERRRLAHLVPDLSEAAQYWARHAGEGGASLPVCVGTLDLDPVVELVGGDELADAEPAPELRHALSSLRRAAAVFDDAPWLLDGRDGIAVVGPEPLARAVARSLALQLLSWLSPEVNSLTAPRDEAWTRALPHAVAFSHDQSFRVLASSGDAIEVGWGRSTTDFSPSKGSTILLSTGRRERCLALSAAQALDQARALARQADSLGLLAAQGVLPALVPLAELLGEPPSDSEGAPSRPTLSAPIGRDLAGVVELDLVREGPHAVVAGTTGAGKSEFLVSWVLAMAARHPPTAVTFLLVDFKGGAAFAPLVKLAHVVGIVSDLDARRSRRAIESLRAELRRRENLLARFEARSLEELPPEESVSRLVIVVDEFAAVVAGEPELHEVFADLAARGRSLGLHLVLCTQRPAGVIRDSVLANVTLRISLRVIDRGDSIAMLGSDAASTLAPELRGRAVIADGTGTVREVQLALADQADAERIRGNAREAATAGPHPVWCEPLAELIRLDDLQPLARREDPSGRRIALGRSDLPAEQRQPIAWHDPLVDGHLLVLGARRSGKTSALALFAHHPRSTVLPGDPADAWSVLEGLAGAHHAGAHHARAHGLPDDDAERFLIIDDLDVVIDRFDQDARHEFVERLARLARESRQLCLIAGAHRLTPGLQRLAPLFGSRVLLRQANRDEHILAGGDGQTFDPRLPAGSGIWRGDAVQLAFGGGRLPAPARPELASVRLAAPGAGGRETLAIIAGHPRELEEAIAARGARLMRLSEDRLPDDAELRVWGGQHPIVLLGDPDAWQAHWSLLGQVRREVPLVVIGCTAAELRAVARIREVPPPLGHRPGECWLIEHGEVRRAQLEI